MRLQLPSVWYQLLCYSELFLSQSLLLLCSLDDSVVFQEIFLVISNRNHVQNELKEKSVRIFLRDSHNETHKLVTFLHTFSLLGRYITGVSYWQISIFYPLDRSSLLVEVEVSEEHGLAIFIYSLYFMAFLKCNILLTIQMKPYNIIDCFCVKEVSLTSKWLPYA